MNSLFVSFGIFTISIILAAIATFYFDITIPSELTIIEAISESVLVVWILPISILIVALSTLLVIKKSKAPKSNDNIKKITNFSTLILLLLQIAIVSNNSNTEYDLNVAIGVLVGIVIIVLANFMPKTKANLAYGLRLPWTLNNEEVWRKSNRFAAKLLMLAGLFILSFALVLPHALEIIVVVSLAITVVISVIYSYFISKQQVV